MRTDIDETTICYGCEKDPENCTCGNLPAPKHTPGPWRIESDPITGDNSRLIVGPDNVLIADAYPESAGDFKLPENYQANAALLAAAPEMENALRLYIKLDNDFRAGITITPENWAECHQEGMSALFKVRA